MIKLLRWLLVPIAGVAAWWAAIFIMAGIDLIYWQFDYPCPKGELLSEGCPGVSFDWFVTYTNVMIRAGAALAAILVVVACTLAAPRHRLRTAVAAYAVGCGAAFLMANLTGELQAGAWALVAGGFTLAILWRRRARYRATHPE